MRVLEAERSRPDTGEEPTVEELMRRLIGVLHALWKTKAAEARLWNPQDSGNPQTRQGPHPPTRTGRPVRLAARPVMPNALDMPNMCGLMNERHDPANEPASVAAENRFREAAAELLRTLQAEGHPDPAAAVRAALAEALR